MGCKSNPDKAVFFIKVLRCIRKELQFNRKLPKCIKKDYMNAHPWLCHLPYSNLREPDIGLIACPFYEITKGAAWTVA
jgi:hypothetical protein